MFLTLEEQTKLNELISKYADEYQANMVVSQTDKYVGTEHETIMYGLISTKGLKKEDYHFNKVEATSDTDLTWKEYVRYYEKLERVLVLFIVNSVSGLIQVYEVGYTGSTSNPQPTYHKLEEVKCKSIQDKVVQYV
jgi:hypothetical protein